MRHSGKTRWWIIGAIWLAALAALGAALLSGSSSFGYRAERIVLTRGEGEIPHKFELITEKRVSWLPGPLGQIQPITEEEFFSYARALGGAPNILPTGFALVIARDSSRSAEELEATRRRVEEYLREGR